VTATSRRLLAALLFAFPRPFRDEYGADMEACFADRLAVVRRQGRRAVARLWLRTAANLVMAGCAERRRSSFLSMPAASEGHPMTGWTQDLRYALRRLRQEPGYTAFVVLTLALGLAANVAVFSVVNGVLWTALPFPDSGRLVAIYGRFLPESGFDFPQFSLSNPELLDYGTENRTMAAVGGWQSVTVTVGGSGEEPERVPAVNATPGLFSVLRVPPYMGRVLGDGDRESGPASVALLSHGFWKRRFGARADIVGQPIVINGTPRTVVGVMPGTFDFPAGVQVWLPMYIDPASPGNRQGHSTDAIGRLADGVGIEQASREMDVLMAGWKGRFPAIHTGHFLYLAPLLEDTIGDVRPALSVLLAATGLLLLIVCANVASLVLARAERRAREAAIRSALGSGR
jgi:predicted permease